MRWRSLGALAAAGILLLGCASPNQTASGTAAAPAATPQGPTLPERLSDADYWKLLSDISEPGGYFRIEDNYTSNEMEVGQLFTMLRDARVAGGVYMGVGPEQNFTYIAAIRPKMAFIVDIRRQAVMQHLMFKAMFEMAPDRADFVSLLFAKPRPSGLTASTPIQQIWDAYRPVRTDSALAARNNARVVERLTKTHGFTFTPEESEMLKRVFDAFYYWGPAISTRGGQSPGRGGDFAELTGYSTDRGGQPRSFLSDEENYRYVKSLHDRNLIVPVSGDFGGPKAIRAIGSYVKEHAGTVRAFYVSNVEQYLFGDMKADAFYDNVAALPVDSGSVFIRPYSMRRFGFNSGAGNGPVNSLCPIAPFIAAAKAGRVLNNSHALECVQ